MKRFHFSSFLLLTLALLMVLCACSGRHKLDIFEVYGDEVVKTKVERTQYIAGAVLAAPLEREKYAPGNGNVVILFTGSRGPTASRSSNRQLLAYDEYRRYELYLQLPSRLAVTSFSLPNNAILQMLGNYERSTAERVFFPINGTLVVDSLPKGHLYGTVEATFENPTGEQVGFKGQFKVRIRE